MVVQQIINNSGFVSIKFKLIFLSNINSYYQAADLTVLFQSLSSFKTFLSFLRKLQLSRFYFSVAFRRSRDQTKQTLAVTLLFQCSFLLLLGAGNLVLQFYFFCRILSTWCWISTKVFIDFSIPSACTQIFSGIIRRVNFIADE